MSYLTTSGFGRLIDPKHKAVCRAVGYAITLKDHAAMWALATVIYARLTPGERVFLAVAALWGLTDDEYREAVQFMECDQ